jgi:hypothetical protein
MALRHANVQAQVEKILDVAPFFPKDDYYKMKVSLQVNLFYLPHPEDPKWMEVYMPPYLVLRER